MDRKKFLSLSTLSALSISTFGQVLADDQGFIGDCETTNDILGPFYRKGAPLKQDLRYKKLAGNQVVIKGVVYGSDCVTPLPEAQVEIWHCNTEGEYDNSSDNYRQRGRWLTDKAGSYAFHTILPGKYLNGALYRPAHIHFRVTASGYQELISQVYFKNDPHIEKDPWASKPKAKQRILPLVMEDTAGSLVVNFPIYLTKK